MPAEQIEIMPIAEEHIQGFHECLDCVARERLYLASLQAPPVEAARAFVRGNIAEDAAQFVAVAGGRVVGWCDITPLKWEGLSHGGVLGMGVHPDFRGRGAGARLLNATLEKARQRGLERVELEVFASNTRAIRLYEKVGFEREGVKIRARKIDGGYEDMVMMALLF